MLMNVALTPLRTFAFAAASAFFGGLAFMYFVNRMDFPNNTTERLSFGMRTRATTFARLRLTC